MPTWHPAALLRDETKKIDFINDLKLVREGLEQVVTFIDIPKYLSYNNKKTNKE